MFKENPNFFPTPDKLIRRMLEKVETLKIKYILEPSCGKGNIIDYYKKYYLNHNSRYIGHKENTDKYITFDAIEIDENLSSLLKGKGINVVWDDFLSFEPQRFYDLIIANFPFDRGVDHLLKAIEIQERIGGQILCIINAESLRNQYSNNRKHLATLLNKYNAEIEYTQNAFTESERYSDVEIAMIYIDVPMQNSETMFEHEFKRENPDISFEEVQQSIALKKNKLEQLIFECEMIKKSGIELFKEKLKIDKLLEGMGLKSKLGITDDTYNSKPITVNEFINKINLEYWNKFINETNFKDRLPSKLRNNFTYNMEKQKDITFNMENVQYFYEELMKSIPQSYEETIAQVFDSITSKHYYSDREWEKNIHCYSGWKSNNGFKINSKCVISCYNNGWLYSLPELLTDFNIIFENISGTKDDLRKNNNELLERIKRHEKKIETEFFILDSYKKQTLHITFKNKDYLNAFNILAGKGKNTLPPDFGEKPYNNMTREEKEIVNNFGLNISEYSKICLISKQNNLLRLAN
jgi:hypothetical protein